MDVLEFLKSMFKNFAVYGLFLAFALTIIEYINKSSNYIALYAFLSGLHYWWPKMFGKMYSEFQAQIAYWLIFIGFNLTFFIQFIMGSKGMPRRYATYLPEFQVYHQLSTIGSYLIAIGFLVMLYYLVQSIRSKEKAPQNPWGALTLEWTHIPAIPGYHAFDETPIVTAGPYDYPSEDDQ